MSIRRWLRECLITFKLGDWLSHFITFNIFLCEEYFNEYFNLKEYFINYHIEIRSPSAHFFFFRQTATYDFSRYQRYTNLSIVFLLKLMNRENILINLKEYFSIIILNEIRSLFSFLSFQQTYDFSRYHDTQIYP